MPPLGARRINRKKSTQFVAQRTGNRGEMAGFGSLNRLGLGHATGIRRAQRLALMAHLDAETSNRNEAILEELANWNTELKRLNSPALQPGKEVKP